MITPIIWLRRKVLLILFAFLAVLQVQSQDVAPPFSVSISSPPGPIQSGSIVRLDITIKSNSSELLILSDNRIGPEVAGIRILDSAGTELKPREEFRVKPDSLVSGIGLAVEPGRSRTESVYLNRWFDLTKPDQYSVQVKRRVPRSNVTVESNRLTITLVP